MNINAVIKLENKCNLEMNMEIKNLKHLFQSKEGLIEDEEGEVEIGK